MIWRCPRCRGLLVQGEGGLNCAACSSTYECIGGIPDLRVPGASWIDVEADKAEARRLLAETAGVGVEELVRYVYRSRPDWDHARIELRTRQVMAAPARLRKEINGWLKPCVTSGGRFLDLGCGPGTLLAAAAVEGWNGIGVDVSLSWLVVARRLIEEWGGQPLLAAALAEALPLANDSVSGVISLDVIEHVANPGPYLREIDRVTAPGGSVALSTPNRYSLAAEPHVAVWGVGWLPRPLQPRYVMWRSGKRYESTRLLSAREASGALRRQTRFRFEILVPPVPEEEIAHFSGHRARLARWYNRLARFRLMHGLLRRFGPFYRIVGTKKLAPEAPRRVHADAVDREAAAEQAAARRSGGRSGSVEARYAAAVHRGQPGAHLRMHPLRSLAGWRALSALVLLLPACARAAPLVSVVVDNTKPHQVMDGFGCSQESLVIEGLGDTLTPELRARGVDAVYHQAGITMGNLEIGAFETPSGYSQRANDDDDPFHFNWSGFNFTLSDAMKQKLVDLAQPYGFHNYSLSGRMNTRWEMPWLAELRKTDYNRYLDEAGEHVAAAAIHWRDAYGIVPRYYHLFNEPLTGNHELDGGTVQDLVDITKRAGARLRREGFAQMKFVLPSEETEEASLQDATALLADPEARQYIGAIGYHAYPYGSVYANVPNLLRTSGAGAPDPGRIAVRKQLCDLTRKYGVPLWMTEVSNGGVPANSFDDLRARAIHIHDELVYAGAAAYFGMLNLWDTALQQAHFGNTDLMSQEGNVVLIDNPSGTVYITGMGYAIGHYARWIKPGAVRIEATSSDPLLLITAFRDDAQKTVVLVLINNASAAATVNASLQGFAGPQNLAFVGEQSTAEAAWKPLPPFTAADPAHFSVTLPALSVTSLSAKLAGSAS